MVVVCFLFFSFYTHLPAYEDGTECSETSAHKIQTPGNYPAETIQHSEHDESLKSRMMVVTIREQRYVCEPLEIKIVK